jgi:5'-deoxynucleotidase YfbR-like HD superfamily hydrolase/nucleoside phosphorylase
MKSSANPEHIEVGLVIALKEEFDLFKSMLAIELVPKFIEDQTYYKFKFGTNKGKQSKGVAICLGEKGMDISMSKTRSLLDQYDPLLLVNIGIAGLVNDDLKLLDVLVARASCDYIYGGKVVSPNESVSILSFDDIQFGGRSLPTSSITWDFFKNVKDVMPEKWNLLTRENIDFLKKNLKSSVFKELKKKNLFRTIFKVHCEDIACGPFVGASNKFKKWLHDNNRNYYALDMESYGMLNAVEKYSRRNKPYTLILKGISDPSDEFKSQLDTMTDGAIRKAAMRNAIEMLKMFFSHYDQYIVEAVAPPSVSTPNTEVSDNINPEATAKYSTLKPPLSKIENLLEQAHMMAIQNIPELVQPYILENSSKWIDHFNRLLLHFYKPWVNKNENQKGLVDTTYNEVVNSASTYPLQIEGPAGSGASEFLSLFYLYAYEKAKSDSQYSFPIFLSLPHYNSIIYDDEHGTLEEQASAKLMSDLKPLIDAISQYPENRYLIIVDGYSELSKFKESLINKLKEIVASCQHQKIIGVWMPETKAKKGQPVDLLGNDEKATETLKYAELSLNYERLDRLVDDYLQVRKLSEDTGAKEFMLKSLKPEHFSIVDLFTLDLLGDYYLRKTKEVTNLSDLLHDHCAWILRSYGVQPKFIETTMLKAAALAFEWEIEKNDFSAISRERLQSNIGWELLHTHAILRDYLVAEHIVSEIQKIGNIAKHSKGRNHLDRQKKIAYVYPHRVNRLCKEIINNRIVTQQEVLNAAKHILQSGEIKLQSHVCYLLGRLEADQLKVSAMEVLKRFLQTQEQKLDGEYGSERKPRLHLVRTIYISLSYLGDTGYQRKYIEKLTYSTEWDDLNRGFHLEYYGDIEYLPMAGLLHQDTGASCSRTFWMLYRRCESMDTNPLFEIELYTLLSLSQHRLDLCCKKNKEKFPDEFINPLLKLIKKLLEMKRITYPLLKHYAEMVVEALEDNGFSAGKIIEQLYELKRLKRKGWVIRKIQADRIESVAEHTFGSMLLAQYFLPERCAEIGYSKDTILRMLLVHDLAEVYIGDLLGNEKNDETREQETDWYEHLSLQGTYRSASGLRNVGELWKKFETRADINSKIAQEMDKLENLVQLYIYHKQDPIDSFEHFRNSLVMHIETEYSIMAMNAIEQYFHQLSV